MKLLLIAKNNMKKAKASTITLVLLVAIATILLYVGTNVLSQIGTFIDDKNNELNGAHEIVIASRDSSDDIQSIYEGIDDFSYMEQEDAIMYGASEFQNLDRKEKKYAMPSIVLNYDTKRTISKVEIIDKSEEEYENGMIVPYIMKVANGYHTGDTLRFFVDDKSVEFIIAGFYEDVMFSNPTNLSIYKLFVYDEQFSKLQSDLGGTNCSVSVAILKNIENATDFEDTLIAKIKTDMKDISQVYMTSNYLTLKIGTSVFILIIMSVLVAFSGIILLISLIVIRFSTTTHIENSIKNIGAMEACGYTPRQLIAAILLEYGITATFGVVLGILLALGVTPFITQIVSASIGLRWNSKPSMMAIGISFVIIMLLVLAISYISAAKIKKITPLIALRSGIDTHNFKKNRIPLDKTKLNVHVAISAKEFIYNKRQNMVAGIIIMLLSMVCVFAMCMYYNFVIDSSGMMNLVGIENAQIELKIPNDTTRIYEEVKKMPEVKKTIMLEGLDTLIKYNGKESNPHFQITQDYSILQIKTCVEGRMPEHDNEISMTKLVLDEIGAKIGDTVEIAYNNSSKEYLVVGITQHISYLGRGAEITTAGMQRLVDDYESKTAMIYLNDNEDTSAFITKLNDAYEDQGIQINNNKEMLDKMMESFSGAIKVISIGCIIVTVVVIVFIMFLIIRARVLKERMRMGVSKALGYTSNQLIGHILISQIPVILFSSIIGAITSLYATNPIMALSLASNGILHCSFYVDMKYVILTPIGISLIGFVTVILVAGGIRKISSSTMFEQAKN